MPEEYRLKELKDLKNFFIAFGEFEKDLILKTDAAKRLFDVAKAKRPDDPETACLLARYQTLEEVLQSMERKLKC